MKKLIIGNIIFALVVALLCLLVANRKRKPEPVINLDETLYYKARSESLQVELNERIHNEFLRSRKKDEIIIKKYEKTPLVFTITNLDSIKREKLRVIARLDSKRPPYRTENPLLFKTH